MSLKEKIQTIIDEMDKADGWNATEMTAELAKRGWLPELHTVIDIADVMTEMWGRPPGGTRK